MVNAPFNVTSNSSCRALRWYGGAGLYLNDTVTDNMYGGLTIQAFSTGILPAGASATYWPIGGYGNPLITATYLGGSQLHLDHVLISAAANGQIGIEAGAFYSTFKNIVLSSNGTSIALDLTQAFDDSISSVNFGGFNVYAFTSLTGQGPSGMPIMGPLIPNIEIADGDGASILMDGLNSGSGKGIELYSTNSGQQEYSSRFKNINSLQAPYTPVIWTYGNVSTPSITIDNVIADSISEPCFSNFGSAVNDLSISACLVAGGPSVGGDANRSLNFSGYGTMVGQNLQVTIPNSQGNTYAGPYNAALIQSETQQNKPFVFSSVPNMPLFWNALITSSSTTAAASGVGTITAGTYNVCVLAVGWNGGDGDYGPTSCASATLNGSQGIQIGSTAISRCSGIRYLRQWIPCKRQHRHISPGNLHVGMPLRIRKRSFR